VVAEFTRRKDDLERPPEVDELTPGDLSLLARVAPGESNVEIAEEDEVDVALVAQDVGGILATLRLRDRGHAVVFAHEHGLVERH
jgi:DNA-binding NarL/FixJ family response regulator